MVIGCAPGASCLGPAYEFAFEVDHALKRRGMRNQVPITFVTPEPFLGHFGVGGMGRARQFLEGELEHRDIRYRTSAAISKITESSVELASGEVFESRYTMVIPPLAGVPAVARSPGLANPKGFVPTDESFRHKEFANVYAVGVAVGYPPVDQTPVPVNFPKTGAHDGADGQSRRTQHRCRHSGRRANHSGAVRRMHHGHGRYGGADARRSLAPAAQPDRDERRAPLALGQAGLRAVLHMEAADGRV